MKLDESKRKTLEHPFPPLYDKDSRILILGSFPSVKSREQEFFYGHPQNRFWKVTAGVLSEKVPVTIEEKKEFLHRNHIALWDVIHSCDIIGSSDSSIRNVVPNNLTEIFETADIQAIYCNGAKSYQYYEKYQEEVVGRKAVTLPSTSPANAAFSVEKLMESWKMICKPLKAALGEITPVLLNWYDYNARILPWRSEPTPYHVWISEIMLQQTRVEAVRKYYDRWMDELPNVQALAEVSEDKLLKLWEGLGYYNRARNLKAAATTIMEEYDGELPGDYEQLLSLKGIGEYTAGAIASIAFGLPEPAVDGNVLRVFSRLLAQDGEIGKQAVKKSLAREVRRVLPKERPGDFNQALMDLGATICLPNGQPLCDKCPWEAVCQAHKMQKETDFPVKPKKKQRRIEERAIFLIEIRDEQGEERVLLHKRAARGLLPGLWELPNVAGRYTMERATKQMKEWHFPDWKQENVQNLGKGKHIFSHIEWQMTGYRFLFERVRLHEIQKILDSLDGIENNKTNTKQGEHKDTKQSENDNWVLVSKKDLKENYAIPSAFDSFKKWL